MSQPESLRDPDALLCITDGKAQCLEQEDVVYLVQGINYHCSCQ